MLYEAIRANLETFLAELGSEGRELPRYVVDELREYLRCGIFEHGFSRVACEGCGQEEALPFSCKNRFVCPSCCARRMYETAAHLVDRVLPRARYRQWVLSYPFALRLALARDLAAAQQSQRIFIEEIFRWQRAAAKRAGHEETQPGAIACTQRFGSFLNLNVHHHTVVPDGVFVRDASGALGLVELPRPGDEELAAILRRVVARTAALAAERGLLAREADGPLAELQAEAVQGVLPLGQALTFWPRPPRKGVAELEGYSLEANAHVHENDRQGLEHLCRYLLRPPFALSRLRDAGDGRILLTLRKPRRDGTTELAFTPREMLRRLAAQVAPPRAHLVRFHGVFGPAAKDRAKVVPRSTPRASKCQVLPAPPQVPTVAERYSAQLAKDPHSPRRLDWASLLKRTWDLDVLQCHCGGRRRVMAFVMDKDEARRILHRLGLPATGPPLAPARPPQWQAELELQPPEELGIDPTYPEDGAQQPASDEL